MRTDVINIYRCFKGHETVTIDMAYGVTNYSIDCQYPGCTCRAISQCYQVNQKLSPSHGWVRRADDSKFTPVEQQWHENGGLFLKSLL